MFFLWPLFTAVEIGIWFSFRHTINYQSYAVSSLAARLILCSSWVSTQDSVLSIKGFFYFLSVQFWLKPHPGKIGVPFWMTRERSLALSSKQPYLFKLTNYSSQSNIVIYLVEHRDYGRSTTRRQSCFPFHMVGTVASMGSQSTARPTPTFLQPWHHTDTLEQRGQIINLNAFLVTMSGRTSHVG